MNPAELTFVSEIKLMRTLDIGKLRIFSSDKRVGKFPILLRLLITRQTRI